MAFFTIARAIFVRVLFAIHGFISVWRLHMATGDARYWYIITALLLMIAETVVTIHKKKGNEWKWFCPSVFLYLLCVVPAIWFLELNELEKRIALRSNVSESARLGQNQTKEDMSIGFGINIPLHLTSDQWVRSIEQILLLFLIIGRWLLPKGKLTHDQLSQLLLVYIGTAADIVEFFEAFKEDQVKYNRLLCKIILGIWSWSLIQFAMVLTATKARKDQSGLVSKQFPPPEDETCCTPDVYGIIISILLQDAPFLVLRLVLIFKYQVLSYTNMFFTCKNTLVIMLLLYRLIVVQWERRTQRMKSVEYMNMPSESSSRVRLVPNSSYSVDTYYSLVSKSKVNLKELEEGGGGGARIRPVTDADDDIQVNYVIKRHYSMDKLDNPAGVEVDDGDDDGGQAVDLKALQDCFESEFDDDDDDDEHFKSGEKDVMLQETATDKLKSSSSNGDLGVSRLLHNADTDTDDNRNDLEMSSSPHYRRQDDQGNINAKHKAANRTSNSHSVYENIVDVQL